MLINQNEWDKLNSVGCKPRRLHPAPHTEMLPANCPPPRVSKKPSSAGWESQFTAIQPHCGNDIIANETGDDGGKSGHSGVLRSTFDGSAPLRKVSQHKRQERERSHSASLCHTKQET